MIILSWMMDGANCPIYGPKRIIWPFGGPFGYRGVHMRVPYGGPKRDQRKMTALNQIQATEAAAPFKTIAWYKADDDKKAAGFQHRAG